MTRRMLHNLFEGLATGLGYGTAILVSIWVIEWTAPDFLGKSVRAFCWGAL